MAEPSTDFSFERDVSPFATRLFGSISANRDLSPEAKTRLQGRLLGNVMEIEGQRLELEAQRTQNDLRRLQLMEGRSALEDARMRRIRMEQDSAKIGDVKGQIQGILASDLPYDQKQSQIAQMQLNYVDNTDPAIQNAFKIAASAIPKPQEMSPTMLSEAGEYEVPPEIAATGNPYLIGRFVGEAKRERKRQELGFEMAQKDAEGAKRQKRAFESELLESDLDFMKSEEGEMTQWLEPDSTAKVGLMVDAYGTPEEKQVFEATRTAENDMRRMELFYKIRSRVLLDKVKQQQSGMSSLRDEMGL